MIKKITTAIGLCLLSQFASAYDDTFTAKAMQELCSIDDTKSAEYVTCISNINGYMEGLVHAKVFEEMEKEFVTDKSDGTLQLHQVCLDSEVSNYQLSKIFLKYIDGHPEMLHKDFFTVFYDSMKNSFPCKP